MIPFGVVKEGIITMVGWDDDPDAVVSKLIVAQLPHHRFFTCHPEHTDFPVLYFIQEWAPTTDCVRACERQVSSILSHGAVY
jgi:hypothetical protein